MTRQILNRNILIRYCLMSVNADCDEMDDDDGIDYSDQIEGDEDADGDKVDCDEAGDMTCSVQLRQSHFCNFCSSKPLDTVSLCNDDDDNDDNADDDPGPGDDGNGDDDPSHGDDDPADDGNGDDDEMKVKAAVSFNEKESGRDRFSLLHLILYSIQHLMMMMMTMMLIMMMTMMISRAKQ